MKSLEKILLSTLKDFKTEGKLTKIKCRIRDVCSIAADSLFLTFRLFADFANFVDFVDLAKNTNEEVKQRRRLLFIVVPSRR